MSTDAPAPQTPAAGSAVGTRDLLAAVAAAAPEALADVVSSLSWSAPSPDELLEYLQRCVDVAVRAVPAADGAGVTTELPPHPVTTAQSGPQALRLDAAQYAVGDGPCLHALRTQQLVCVDLAETRSRWPAFAAAAAEEGVGSFLAAPLAAGAAPVGVLNLYSTDPAGFGAHDVAVLTVIVDQATRTVADHARGLAAEEVTGHLRTALTRRAVIEQAKGILMAAHQVGADEAFEMLRTRSQATNVKLHTLCTEFVAASSTPGSS